MDWSTLFGGVGRVLPLVNMLGGPAAPIALAVSRAILEVERTIRGAGSKRAKALELVATFVDAAEGASGRDLVADDLVQQATGKIIDAEVALRNAHADLEAVIVDIKAKRAAVSTAPLSMGDDGAS